MLVVAAIVAVLPHHHRYGGMPAGFRSQQGIDVHAGFLDGCARGGSSELCGCLWTKLTATPQGNTSEGFVVLMSQFAKYRRTGKPSELPPSAIAAIRSCSPAGSSG